MPIGTLPGPYRLKLGVFTVSEIVVVALRFPEVPVMVNVLVPPAAVELAVRVNVLLVVADAGENVAVTPFGRPETARFTDPVNPDCGRTVTVEVTEPPRFSDKPPGNALSVKLGG